MSSSLLSFESLVINVAEKLRPSTFSFVASHYSANIYTCLQEVLGIVLESLNKRKNTKIGCLSLCSFRPVGRFIKQVVW